MRDPPKSIRVELEAAPIAPRRARRVLGAWLEQQGCPDQSRDKVFLVVTELVTNAVMHARSDVVIEASRRDGRVRVVVGDQKPSPPTIRAAAGPDGGFGLRVVQALTDDWGWTATDTGKQVWTEISL